MLRFASGVPNQLTGAGDREGRRAMTMPGSSTLNHTC
jgi:hypothetical protein